MFVALTDESLETGQQRRQTGASTNRDYLKAAVGIGVLQNGFGSGCYSSDYFREEIILEKDGGLKSKE